MEKALKLHKSLLTYDVHHSHVGQHGVRVDLAHVVSLVLLLHVLDVEAPRVVLVVCDGEARDAGDHLVVDRQDHLTVQVDEGHLREMRLLQLSHNLFNGKTTSHPPHLEVV